ncbi:cell surface protein SprA [Arcticibacter tournemirensis]|uniref:Cell surface protein SprA n=1 Tax=Arcticibacter tournemirensis TaxID=699437 RepID=A0A5M9HH71_9SPHI|nr:cell surface protein SprA [Arcticibacter tournemirensis]KAA8484678.1 cell surface protein SprA [Arcticibacter tournemirensis]
MRRISAIFIFSICSVLCLLQLKGFAQRRTDSLRIPYPFKDTKTLDLDPAPGFYLQKPSNIKRSVEFDPASRRYIIREMIGDRLYRPPQYLTIEEYERYETEQLKRDYWRQLTDTATARMQQNGLIPSITVNSRAFERIFGGSTIDIRPQGSADLTLSGRINKNENPLFNERQRKQTNFDFDQRIQMNVTGQIGKNFKLGTNYNTEAQFDFENQMKLDYAGQPDDIIQKIEAGNVSLPLNSTLISGSQALFGIKTQLQFGKLNVTSIFSQQKSQQKEITITNGSQQNEFRISADSYEVNKHFFLAQYFRQNYNQALQSLPLIRSNINITQIEVWVTNRNNSTTDSRDVLALMDLGESNPFDNRQLRSGGSVLPAAGPVGDPAFLQQSNNLLQNLLNYSAQVRNTNSNAVTEYFQGNRGTDNYSKLTYARKLTDREFTLNPRLGYISLNFALNADEVLAVAFRYNYNGVEYQVGEFSSDVPVDPANPSMLFVKLLKNEMLKTNLPTWDLMMKNIYSLGAYQISRNDFNLNIYRLDEKSGVETPSVTEGVNTNGKRWLQLTNLDNLTQNGDKAPDGYFDFIEGITIDPLNGRITFPLLEPFGSDLAAKFNPSETNLRDKYVFQQLYDLTRADAQQLYPGLNRYIIRGTYQSEVGSEFQLNAINIPAGSVQVTAGTLPLVEGTDFTVDYNIGRVRILNQALLNSGQPIRIKLENSELFGLQQRSLFGTHLDYRVNNKLNLGGTIMNLTEKPLTAKVNIGEEPISNTMWGLDANYSSDSRLLTRLVDKIPFIETKEPSSLTFSGEFANLIPGHPRSLNFAGSKNGVSYLDDFEGSRSVIDLKSAVAWQISGTPVTSNNLFPEAALSNDLAYGYNRARLAFYNIDPIFFNRNNSLAPANIRNNRNEQSNHYVREVLEQEVFPLKQSVTGQPLTLPTLDLTYYPNVRGPYNYTTSGVNPDGTLSNPKNRWGGIFRKLETTDFEALNIEFIEFWVLDPFIYKPDSPGGDLYFNLGNISEDILKDGRKSLENGLAPDGDPSRTDETVWGRVPKLQPVIQAFDNNPQSRQFQDAGLEGLTDADERQHFSGFLNQVRGQLSSQAAEEINNDPSSDNYRYFRGGDIENSNAGILKRYERYNGTESNSKTSAQSLAETGVENSAATPLPDGEDVNRDNNMSLTDEFYEYKVSIRPRDMVVGQNFITDKVTSSVKLANGSTQQVSWYQLRIPISQFQGKIGNIEDFKSIRFIRMFMTNFADTAVLRMGRLQLVRGEWRRYNASNQSQDVIVDPALGSRTPDNSTLDVSAINIEENGKRSPIPYVVPPGIERERDLSNYRGETQQNEQSLAVAVSNLRDGYSRAAFKNSYNDFRSYKKLEMFIHAEGEQIRDNDVHAIIRLGADSRDNYYEYEIPLKVTSPGTADPYSIWPDKNKLDLELKKLQMAKAARNEAMWPENKPFAYKDGDNTIYVMGQPDLSKVRVYMLGVRNPLRNDATPAGDDGLDKSAQVWFNELRLTEFDERGGWAATARMNAKLADFADVTVSGSKSTVGFGSIDKRVSERNRSDDRFFDLSTNVELGKFFPERSGIKIPMFFNFSSQRSIPQFDPRSQDIELEYSLANLSKAKRDSIHHIVDDYTQRRSINFTNVRKIRTDPEEKSHLWDIENFSASYAFTEYDHRDFINELSLQKTYRAGLAYNYNGKPKNYAPFAKIIKSNVLALLRDFNFNLMPSVINFRIDVDRLYSENTLRDNSPDNFIRTTYNKNFQMSRLYGISWNLTRSMQIDFNATNYSVIDEPQGKMDRLARDTVWENLKKLGRTTDYSHNLNINYTLPINKIPGLSWTNVIARYGTTFNWRTEPLATLNDPTIDLGNTIQNTRTIQLNPTLNFTSLYNKFGFVRRAGADGSSFLVNALTSIKSITGAYTRTEGTFLPGYLPKTNLFGYDFDADAPGWGFVFGSQKDIRWKAIERGWISRDSLLNQLYITTRKEDINLRGRIEPIRDLTIELTAMKSQSFNYSTNFRFNGESSEFENQSPVTTGDFSISYFSLRTAFKDSGDGKSNLFRTFERNRQIISERLGAINPNSNGEQDGYADGYGKNSQDVVVASFIAAYSGRDPHTISLKRFPKIPVPNWRISYNGLTKYDLFSDLFASFDITHTYRSTYNVNGFNSLTRFRETNGFVSVKDAKGNFLPYYQFSQVTLFEQFVPLFGVDFRMKNNVTANFEYRKTRALSLSLANSQLAQQSENGLVFGLGYRTNQFRFPFGLFNGRKLKNDVNFKVDVAVDDRKTVIYRADVDDAEVSSGAKNITLRPSVDYILNQRLNLRLFYDGNITKPYTSQTFNTSYSNFGINLRFMIQ